MKKFLLTLVFCILGVTSVFGATGKIIDGKTFVPVRGVFEEMGFSVDYDSSTGTAVISNENYTISIPKDKTYFYVNGKSIKPDFPQRIVDGSMYLPLKAINDSIGALTSWDGATKTATVEFNGKKISVPTSGYVKTTKKSILNYLETGKNGRIYYEFDPDTKKQMIGFVEDNIKKGYGGPESVAHAVLDHPQTVQFLPNDYPVSVTEILPGDLDFDYSSFAPGRKYFSYVAGDIITQTSAGIRQEQTYSACVLFNVKNEQLTDMVLAYTIFI